MSSRPGLHYPVVKRWLDIAGSAIILLASLPIQAAVGALVVTRLGRPILFRQSRPGLHGEVFTLLKFRTMLVEDPAKGLVSDEQRLTKLGRTLRATSLDELPTLWNVLRGDLSLVGPRPLLVEYLPRYTVEQSRRHEVRPGITGLAQVSGRNGLSWEEKFRLDVRYVDELSPALDARILLATLRTVLSHEGINETGQATMSRFEGTNGS